MSRARDAGLFVALAVVWGSAFVAIDAGLAHFPPVLYAALRYDVAGALTLAYAAAAVERWRPRCRADWHTVVVGGALVIGAYNALLFVGQQWVTGAVAAVLVGLNPVLTTVFARVLLPGERLAPAGVVGLVVGLAGVAVIADPAPENLLGSGTRGSLLVLGAAASVALGSVLIRRFDAPIATEGRVAWSMALGALGLHVISLAAPGESLAAVAWTPGAVVALAYLAVAASAAGYLVYFDLLDRLGPVEINLISYATPVSAAVAGFFVLGQGVDAATVAGFGCVLAAFALIKRDAIRTELGRAR